jgi:hypothetical protein
MEYLRTSSVPATRFRPRLKGLLGRAIESRLHSTDAQFGATSNLIWKSGTGNRREGSSALMSTPTPTPTPAFTSLMLARVVAQTGIEPPFDASQIRAILRQPWVAQRRKTANRRIELQATARRANPDSIVIHKRVIGRRDLQPGRTVRLNTTAHWVRAKPAVGGSYCACYTARAGVSAGHVELRPD